MKLWKAIVPVEFDQEHQNEIKQEERESVEVDERAKRTISRFELSLLELERLLKDCKTNRTANDSNLRSSE